MSIWRWIMGWIQSLDFVTQSAHFFAGWAVTFTLATAASIWLPWHWAVVCAAVAFSILWVVPKELWFDASADGEGHGKPDWLDATFYWIGQAVACALFVLIFTRLH